MNGIRAAEGMEVLDRHQIAPVIDEESLYDYSKPTHYQIISGDLIQQPNLIRFTRIAFCDLTASGFLIASVRRTTAGE